MSIPEVLSQIFNCCFWRPASVAENPTKSLCFLNERVGGLIKPDEIEGLLIYHEDGCAAGIINSVS